MHLSWSQISRQMMKYGWNILTSDMKNLRLQIVNVILIYLINPKSVRQMMIIKYAYTDMNTRTHLLHHI